MSSSHPTRRHVLTASAGLFAIPLVYRASRAAASAETPLRWGLIGTGTRGGGTHVPVIKAHADSRIVAMCDVADDRLQAAATRYGDKVAAYADHQKLLADPNVNAVVIATPNLFHRAMLLEALQAGKHVLCEKPAGVSMDDAAAIAKASAEAKTVVMFGIQYRNRPQERRIAKIVAEGKIGRPQYLVQNVSRGDWNLNANVWRYRDPKVNGGAEINWRMSHAATGGTLNEFDCHYFDLLHGLAGGVPQRVAGTGGISVYRDGRDTWDHASVTLAYAGGVKAVHTLCLFGPGRADLTIFGDEGAIEAVGDKLVLSARGGKAKGARRQELPAEPVERRSNDDATLALYEDFLACVTTGKKPDAGVDRAVAASRTCWLAEQSARDGVEVAWNG